MTGRYAARVEWRQSRKSRKLRGRVWVGRRKGRLCRMFLQLYPYGIAVGCSAALLRGGRAHRATLQIPGHETDSPLD